MSQQGAALNPEIPLSLHDAWSLVRVRQAKVPASLPAFLLPRDQFVPMSLADEPYCAAFLTVAQTVGFDLGVEPV